MRCIVLAGPQTKPGAIELPARALSKTLHVCRATPHIINDVIDRMLACASYMARGSRLTPPIFRNNMQPTSLAIPGANDDDASEPPAIRYRLLPDGCNVTCHEAHIPAFAETELERLYGSLFSSLAGLRAYGNLEGTCTYVRRRGECILDLFLFQIHARELRILNEQILISDEALQQFAAFAYSSYPSVHRITLHAASRCTQWLSSRANLACRIIASHAPTTAC
jgi:hypothetical protein